MSDYYSNLRNTRNQQFETDKSELEAYRSLARQEASINNELLKKYLPQLNAQNGLTGLGIADSINLEQLSRYQNTLTDIDRQYNDGLSELERAYRSDMQGYDAAERGEQRADAQREEAYAREDSRNTYSTALSAINEGTFRDLKSLDVYLKGLGLDEDAYKSLLGIGQGYISNYDADKTKSDQDAYFDEVATLIYASDSSEEITRYLDSAKGNVSDSQYDILTMIAGNAKDTIEKKETTESENMGTTDAKGTMDAEGTTVSFSFVPDNDNAKYNFTLYLSAPIEEEAVYDAAKDKEEGDVFVYGNRILLKKNGTIWSLVD